MKKSDTKRIRLQQACNALDINVTTLWRWLKRDNITPVADEIDKRVQTISIAELQRLAREHERSLLSISGEIAMQDKSEDEDKRIASLQQSIEVLEARLDELEKAVARLGSQLAAKETPVMLRPPQTEYRAIAQVHKEQSSSLPDGLVIATTFAKQHGIAESTINKAIDTQRIPVVRGTWKVGAATPTKALDEQGRARFYQLYHNHPNFKLCEFCPHSKTDDLNTVTQASS